MTVLSAFFVLLYRYSGESDLIVGTGIANRNRVEIEPLIGMFANVLALRSQCSDDSSFTEIPNSSQTNNSRSLQASGFTI